MTNDVRHGQHQDTGASSEGRGEVAGQDLPKISTDLTAESVRDSLVSYYATSATKEIVLAMAQRATDVVHEVGSIEATRYAVIQAVQRAANDVHANYSRLFDCDNNSPPGFSGDWKDWHRGHGCGKDDRRPRSARGQEEIGRLNKHGAYICGPCSSDRHLGANHSGSQYASCQCACDGVHDRRGRLKP